MFCFELPIRSCIVHEEVCNNNLTLTVTLNNFLFQTSKLAISQKWSRLSNRSTIFHDDDHHHHNVFFSCTHVHFLCFYTLIDRSETSRKWNGLTLTLLLCYKFMTSADWLNWIRQESAEKATLADYTDLVFLVLLM